MKNFILLLSLTVLTFSGCKQQQLTPVQKLKKAHTEAENIEKIELPDFTFYPNSVTPEFGTTFNVSSMQSSYMKVSKNNIDAELPYLGHFYVKPMDRYEIPVRFNSDKFVYTVSYDKEKDIFDVLISPQDVSELINENMIIKLKMDKDGTGIVTVKTDNRDEITYRGYYK